MSLSIPASLVGQGKDAATFPSSDARVTCLPLDTEFTSRLWYKVRKTLDSGRGSETIFSSDSRALQLWESAVAKFCTQICLGQNASASGM